jgi:hypothetical protein
MHANCCRLGVCLLTFITTTMTAAAQEKPRCDDVRLAAEIMRAKSLTAIEKGGASSYIVDVVSAIRAFQLRPRSRTLAARLLTTIPQNEDQQGVILALDSSICDAEAIADIEVLARAQDSLPRMLARAVRLVPSRMSVYVSYALVAVGDPHSDYTIQMQRVCRELHSEFTQTVQALAEKDRQWFIDDVFDPKRCRAIAVPESE